MGFLDRFRKHEASSRPEDLRGALADAFRRQDSSALMSLINENGEAIRAQFRSWTNAPESIRNDPSALDGYVRMLFTIAELFERSGDSSLKDSLTGPMGQWEKNIGRVDGLINNG